MSKIGEIRGLRATFEDVLDNQEELRKKLDILIAENRPLIDDEEREEYFRLVARSTMGVTSHGTGHEIEFKAEKDGVHVLGNVEKIARWMGYIDNKRVVLPTNPKIEIEIEKMWRLLRDYMFDIWPKAQNEAIKISPERERGRALGGPGAPTRY